MTYVVTDNCVRCKYTDCVEVCPVDCFYVGENFLVIHPDECIDCGVCEPECPAEAIKPDTEPGADKWLKLNADYDRIIPLGNIVDFICIKLPKDGKEGHIDFVDIKTGGSAKLSKDQVGLKRLIEEKKIKFIKYKIEATTEISEQQ